MALMAGSNPARRAYAEQLGRCSGLQCCCAMMMPLACSMSVRVSMARRLLPFTVAAAGFGVAILTAALVPSLPGELAALAIVGFFSTAFMATSNTTLQLTADPRFRGRVMALWSVTFTGSTPIGGPVVGVVADDLGPRYGPASASCGRLAGLPAGTRNPRMTAGRETCASHMRPHAPRPFDWSRRGLGPLGSSAAARQRDQRSEQRRHGPAEGRSPSWICEAAAC